MESKPTLISCLFDALKAVNDNLLILAENLAETHGKVARIEDILTMEAEPTSSGTVGTKRKEEKTK